ncbi:hypothetical protein RYX45_14555 [Alkalihalophilus pseudofirmus]|uniref:Uncharacterized protein n=1 Tax=Alkalihalophilus pseudofirmus TaxID=79885 RepID=A0AAJ2NQ29_ALKPS|nr:hypothetical protein [Alkalihalophilus pseudofirmus]MDV2886408.1 hypothetical protein [Alkalihalophilus pseudofirmus]
MFLYTAALKTTTLAATREIPAVHLAEAAAINKETKPAAYCQLGFFLA